MSSIGKGRLTSLQFSGPPAHTLTTTGVAAVPNCRSNTPSPFWATVVSKTCSWNYLCLSQDERGASRIPAQRHHPCPAEGIHCGICICS